MRRKRKINHEKNEILIVMTMSMRKNINNVAEENSETQTIYFST